MVEITFTIEHPAGLHLRPAALFVQTAARFTSHVRLKNLSRANAPEVDAKSLFGIMQSGVSQGDQVWICAEGPDESAAIAALQALVERNLEAP